ncbi:MAG: hypothetical protein ACFFCF_10960 [Promethearchaeota archaeon]
MRRIHKTVAIFILASSIFTGFFPLWSSLSTKAYRPEASYVSTDSIWSITHGSGTGPNCFYSIAACQAGGFIATGVIQDPDQGIVSIPLVRIAEDGSIFWSRMLQPFNYQVGREVIECQSGGYAIIGETMENNHDAILIRTDDSGNVSWCRTYGRSAFFDTATCLVECQSGGFAFAGYGRDGTLSRSDFWLVRTDDQGTLLWNRYYGRDYDDFCYSLIETDTRNFVLAGSTKDVGMQSEDGWILQTTSLGSENWNVTWGGVYSQICRDLVQINSGNLVTIGSTDGVTNQNSDGFLLSLDIMGNILWSTTFGGTSEELPYAITECQNSTYAVTGRISELDGDQYSRNLWLVRLNYNGEQLWTKSYGGHAADEGWSILLTLNGDFVIVGMSESLVEGYGAWGLRVPDTPPDITTRIFGPPNLYLIGLGTGLSLLMVLGSYLLLRQSRKEIALPWSKPSRRAIFKSYLRPRYIDELSPILAGSSRCWNCGEVSARADVRCSHCSAYRHRCLFCDKGIHEDELVIFCPSCKGLAHQLHMEEWLRKRDFCPQCFSKLVTQRD